MLRRRSSSSVVAVEHDDGDGAAGFGSGSGCGSENECLCSHRDTVSLPADSRELQMLVYEDHRTLLPWPVYSRQEMETLAAAEVGK